MTITSITEAIVAGYFPKANREGPKTMSLLANEILIYQAIAANPNEGKLPVVDGAKSSPSTTPVAVALDNFVGGGTQFFPTSAATVKLKSSSASDDAGSTGATKVRVIGLNGDFEWLEEIITMDGSVEVATTGAFIRIHAIHVEEYGSAETNLGDIIAYFSVDTNPCATMPAGRARTALAHFTIPVNHVGLILGLDASFKQGATAAIDPNAIFDVFIRPWIFRDVDGSILSSGSQRYGPWQVLRSVSIRAGHFANTFTRPDVVTQKSIVAIVGSLSASSASSEIAANLGITVSPLVYSLT